MDINRKEEIYIKYAYCRNYYLISVKIHQIQCFPDILSMHYHHYLLTRSFANVKMKVRKIDT